MSTTTTLVALATAIAHGGVWAPPERDAPAPAPAVAPAPAAPPTAPAPPSEAKRRTGNGLLIGAGVLAGVGFVLNATRAYIVSGPCQEAGQPACEVSWGFTTAFTWVVNVAALGMSGAGAGLRGSYDAAVDPERQQARRVPFIAVGATLLVAGFATNVTLKSLWLGDYSSPEGDEIFDFAKSSDALAYYGGLGFSSIAMAFGIGMLVHGTIRPRRTAHRRRGTITAAPGLMSFGVSGRF